MFYRPCSNESLSQRIPLLVYTRMILLRRTNMSLLQNLVFLLGLWTLSQTTQTNSLRTQGRLLSRTRFLSVCHVVSRVLVRTTHANIGVWKCTPTYVDGKS